MSPDRFQRIRTVFESALEKSPQERPDWLAEVCGPDLQLRKAVAQMLTNHEKLGGFLENGAAGLLPGFGAQQRSARVNSTDRSLPAPADLAPDFSGNSRFTVLRGLGSGSFGTVYEVWDRDNDSRVALKLLHARGTGQLSRFKHEFRSLVDLNHPNLVRLYELFREDRDWYFTMELIPGSDFLVWATHSADRYARLRSGLKQIAEGLSTLHSAGLIHRDLKPANVLVTEAGRVVVLDFGLVREIQHLNPEQSALLIGSPAYMAPEQAGGGPVSPAADWYSVGVMLYQGLTGRLPFTGSVLEVLRRKQSEDPVPPSEVNPEAPADLIALCCQLLSRSPDSRAGFDAVRRTVAEPAAQFSSRAESRQELFVGRSDPLAALRESYGGALSGRQQVACVSGPTGIGKTTLVRYFLRELAKQHPDALILRGRCYAAESIPYKAFDSLVDELARYLLNQPRERAEAVLPRDPSLLGRLFPTLTRVASLSSSSARPVPSDDEHQVRQRAFSALRELLARLADRQPLVLWIDDIQWSDLDSIALLNHLLSPGDPPPFLLILSYRSEDITSSSALQGLLQSRQERRPNCVWHDIVVPALSPEEGETLAKKLLTEGYLDLLSPALLQAEAQGHPLLLRELVRFYQSQPATAEDRTPASLHVQEMILHRASGLNVPAHRILEIVSVAGHPVSRDILLRAVKLGPEFDGPLHLSQLIGDNLLRIAGGTPAGSIEPYHDQVREIVVRAMPEERRQHWHRRLADVLAGEPDQKPEQLVFHLRMCGDLRGAYKYALEAAASAEQLLAFDQAAYFYGCALDSMPGPEDKPLLLRRSADALAKAGRGREAAAAYLTALQTASEEAAVELQRLACEQLLRSGNFDEGFALLKQILRQYGIWIPKSPIQTVIAAALLRLAVHIRGLDWTEQPPGLIRPHELKRLDLVWSAASSLTPIMPVLGSFLQSRYLLMSLSTGEPAHLSRALGLSAGYTVLSLSPKVEVGLERLRTGLDIAERSGSGYEYAMNRVFAAYFDLVWGRIEEGIEHSREARTALTVRCTGTPWEIAMTDMLHMFLLGWSGRLREFAQILPQIVNEGRARGDRMAEVGIRCFPPSHLIHLAADHPDHAVQDIEYALSNWSTTGFHLQHLGALCAAVETRLYSADLTGARSVLLDRWPALKDSWMFRAPILKTISYYLRARTAMALLGSDPLDSTLRNEAIQYASDMEEAKCPWGEPMAEVIRAGIACVTDDRARATSRLRAAEEGFSSLKLKLHAAAARRRRAELAGDGDLLSQADTVMAAEDVRRPDLFAAVLVPMNPRK